MWYGNRKKERKLYCSRTYTRNTEFKRIAFLKRLQYSKDEWKQILAGNRQDSNSSKS